MKISVFQNEKLISEVALDVTKEYVVGRSRQCDIVLTHPELSRRHLIIKFANKVWECELLSQYGSLYTNGHPVSRLSLSDGSSFKVAEFTFHYSETAASKVDIAVSDVAEAQVETRLQPQPAEPAPVVPDKTVALAEDFSDKTNVAGFKLRSVLYRLDHTQEPIEEISLSDGFIEAGRSSESEIRLTSIKASRKHFSLTSSGTTYVLKDLKSTHGVLINGKKVDEHVLKPGDKIQVGEEILLYEEVHPAFENLPVPSPALSPVAAVYEKDKSLMANYKGYAGAVVKMGGARKNLKPVYAILGVLLIIGVISQLGGESKRAPSSNSASLSSGAADALAKLTEDQRKFLDDTYNLSLNLYTSGKYDLAALEISKIFQLVPQYKDAKNIEALCQQALEIKKQNDEMDRVKQDQESLKEKVAAMVADCEKLLKAKKYSEIDGCVSRVSEMDPENAKARWLIETAQSKMEEIQNSAEFKRESQRRTLTAQRLFQRAQESYKAKRYPAAIGEFSVVAKMDFNDKDGIKTKSSEAIKIAKAKMREESQTFVKEGKAALENKDFKMAITKLNKALSLSPENEDAKTMKERALSDLRVEMKNIYSESVIEENLGNIESAKKKWRLIIDQNLKTDSYYEKAKIKLGKYEK